MFCQNCGNEVEAGAEVCPHCGTKLNTESEKASFDFKNKINKLDPLCIVGFVFSALSFVFGFILITCVFTRTWAGMPTVEFYVLIPTFVGLGIGVYEFFNKKESKGSKAVAAVGTIMSLFIIIYAFIGYMVTLFP